MCVCMYVCVTMCVYVCTCIRTLCMCLHMCVCACACVLSSSLIARALFISWAGPCPITGGGRPPQACLVRLRQTARFFMSWFTLTIMNSITVAFAFSRSACLPFLALFFCLSLHFCLYFIFFFFCWQRQELVLVHHFRICCRLQGRGLWLRVSWL